MLTTLINLFFFLFYFFLYILFCYMLSIIIYKVLCFFFADINYGSLLVIVIIIIVRVILSFLTLTPDYVFLNLEVSNHVICSNDALIIILNEETGEATVIYSDIKDRDFEDIKIIGGSADNISNVATKQNSVPCKSLHSLGIIDKFHLCFLYCTHTSKYHVLKYGLCSIAKKANTLPNQPDKATIYKGATWKTIRDIWGKPPF